MNNSMQGNGQRLQRRYRNYLLIELIAFIITIYICFQAVSFKLLFVIASFLVVYYIIFLYLYFKSTFIDQLTIDDKNIILHKDQSVIKLPIAGTKINQWPEAFGNGGSYLKYDHKRYFVGTQSYFKLQKMQGFSDLYLWLIYGIIALAMLAFFIWLMIYIRS